MLGVLGEAWSGPGVCLTVPGMLAETKAADMTGADIEAMTRSIEGTARSMGLVVED